MGGSSEVEGALAYPADHSEEPVFAVINEWFGVLALTFRCAVEIPLCVLVVQSCLTLQLHGLEPVRLLWPWDSPGKDTGVGCHFLFLPSLGDLPSAGNKPKSPALQADSLLSEPPGEPQMELVKNSSAQDPLCASPFRRSHGSPGPCGHGLCGLRSQLLECLAVCVCVWHSAGTPEQEGNWNYFSKKYNPPISS